MFRKVIYAFGVSAVLAGCGGLANGPIADASDAELEEGCPPFLRQHCPVAETVELDGRTYPITLYVSRTGVFYPKPGVTTDWVRALAVAAVIGEGNSRRWKRLGCDQRRDAPPEVLRIQCGKEQAWGTILPSFEGDWKVAPRQRW